MTTQPTTTRNRILQYLKAHGSAGQAEMSRVMNINKPLLSKTVQRLIQAKKLIGHGSTMNRYYTLSGVATGVGTGVATPVLKVSSPLSETHTIMSVPTSSSKQDESKPSYRNHATYVEYPLEHYSKEALANLCTDKGIDFKQWSMANNYPLFIQHPNGWEIRIYNKALLVVPPDALVPQDKTVPFALTELILRDSYKVAKDTETSIQLKIKQINGLYVGALVRQELAQTNNPLANNILEKEKTGEIANNERTFRIIDPDTDRKCFEFDESPGDWLKSLKEAEATDPQNANNHTTTIHTMLDDVLHKNAWEYLYKSLEKIVTQQGTTTQMLDTILNNEASITTNQITHLPLIKEAKNTLKANNEIMALFNSVMQQFLPIMQEYIAERHKEKAGILDKIKKWFK